MILKLAIFLAFDLNFVCSFFQELEQNGISNDKNLTILDNIEIIIPKNHVYSNFPDIFNVTFQLYGETIVKKFERVEIKVGDQTVKSSYDIYVINRITKQPVKYNESIEETGELYKLVNGEGFARLIRNDQSESPFRLIATFSSDNEPNVVFDIIPIVVVQKKRLMFDSVKTFHQHSIKKRPLEIPIFFDDNIKVDQKTNERQKRAFNDQPIVLNVELLIVADLSVIQNFQRLTGTSDTKTVFPVMRHYYAHLINGVNLRFQNSFSKDPDIRINIILTNFLFLDDPLDQQWLSPQISGDLFYPEYNGRQTVVTTKVVYAFDNYMSSKIFTFEYDHAALLFNKELISSDNTLPISSRVGTAGYSPGRMCTLRKYSVNEDFGGFSNLLTIAHEIGHNLGATHDDFLCSFQTQEYIMASSASFLNLNRFSSCSIKEIKTLLLNPSLNGPSQFGQCLLNVPAKSIELQLGELLTPDDQCKMIYGSTASFCTLNGGKVCQILYCRKNSTETICVGTNPAADGTLCDSGKVCEAGNCVAKPKVRTGICLYGDGVVTQDITGLSLTSPQMGCSDFFKLANKSGWSTSGLCADPIYGDTCCQTCKKYNALKCRDLYWNCPNEANYCLIKQVRVSGVLRLVQDVCPKTCQTCTPSPLTCEQAPNICQNGGICINTIVAQTETFGFKCYCPQGYTGELCEIAPSGCSSNPCKNNGTCQGFGSLNFICICSSGCGGYDCTDCSPTSTSATFQASPGTFTDYNPAACTHFKSENLCNQNAYVNGMLVKEACPVSCNTVQTTTSSSTTVVIPTPTDYSPTACSFFKSQNLCDKNAYVNGMFVKDACPESCNTIQTISTTNSLVTDFNPKVCSYFGSLGYCEKDSYFNQMSIKQACANTCGGFVSTTKAYCFDKYPDLCISWISYCFLLENIPDHPCQKTCLKC